MNFTVSGKTVQMDEADALAFVGVPLTIGSNGYVRIIAKRRTGYVHRVILGAKGGEDVDHINGDKLDNRRVNLRLCTHAENMANTKRRTDNRSGHTGVYWDKARLIWSAQISSKNRMISLGRFEHLEDAIAARVAAETQYHGQFAGHQGQRRG